LCFAIQHDLALELSSASDQIDQPLADLERIGPYANPRLAELMRLAPCIPAIRKLPVVPTAACARACAVETGQEFARLWNA
jgi:hypothetical protein